MTTAAAAAAAATLSAPPSPPTTSNDLAALRDGHLGDGVAAAAAEEATAMLEGAADAELFLQEVDDPDRKRRVLFSCHGRCVVAAERDTAWRLGRGRLVLICVCLPACLSVCLSACACVVSVESQLSATSSADPLPRCFQSR